MHQTTSRECVVYAGIVRGQHVTHLGSVIVTDDARTVTRRQHARKAFLLAARCLAVARQQLRACRDRSPAELVAAQEVFLDADALFEATFELWQAALDADFARELSQSPATETAGQHGEAR